MAEPFALAHPRFRLFVLISILYWGSLIARLFLRHDLEMGDSVSLVVYAIFLIVFVLVLLLSYLSDRYRKGQDLLYSIALFPLRLTLIAIFISLFSFLF
jgi:hypothetical protein